MNASALKIVVPLVLLMGVIFAVTFFSQYKEPDEEIKETKKVASKPIRFFHSIRKWSPNPDDSLMDQAFPGYFEKEATHCVASYWFDNRNSHPAILQLTRVTCTACSEGQLAMIPPDISRQILQMTAISMLPHGLAAPLPLAMTIPAAQLDEQRGLLKWQHHRFDEPQGTAAYEVPAAAPGDPWVEPWGIFQLIFRVGGRTQLGAEFSTRFQGTEEYFEEKFEIYFQIAEPFYLNVEDINVGEMTDDSPVKHYDIIAYSPTRTADKMGKLTAAVTMLRGAPGEPGPFISAGAPTLIPAGQYPDLTLKLGRRVLSAFRIPVTVKVKDGPNKLDIGPVERLISVTQNDETKRVELHGLLRGPVSLANGLRELSFGTFDYSRPQSAAIQIESERSSVELEIVKELTQPKLLKLELTRMSDIGDRGVYKLTAAIAAKEQYGEIKDGVVVLQTKGPNPQKLRIPVSGRGKD